MNPITQKFRQARSGKLYLLQRGAARLQLTFSILFLGLLLCAPLPALAESIVWNGPGDPGNTGQLRPDPSLAQTPFSLFPDAPSGNSVSVNGDVPGYVYGGSVGHWGDTADKSADNSVTVRGGSIEGVIGGYIWNDSPSAMGNRVTISGGIIDIVYGGYALNDSGNATATDNSVTISGGTIGEVTGGYASGHPGSATPTATATGNSFTVSGGTINGTVISGLARSSSGSATATGNSVTVSGGVIGSGIFGGYADSRSGSATATGNSVTLSGSPLFAPTGEIWGGKAEVGGIPGGDSFGDNTLNVWNYSGSAVGSLQNFHYYNFALPASLQNNGTLLSVTGNAYFDDSQSGAATGVQSTVTGVSIMGGGAPLQKGDSVTLMSYGTLGNGVTAANGNSIVEGRKGSTLRYSWQLAQDAAGLTATVLNVDAHPQAKALSEGRAAGIAFVNQGADLAAGAGLDAARRSAAASADNYDLSAFSAFQGGTSRYDTGSHVDVDGFSLLAGLAWNADTDYGKLLLGAFFEAGWGNYDSHNSFSGYASVKGDGNTEYTGGGVLGRFAFADSGPGHVYAETSFRAGWAKTDFSSSDLRDIAGQKADYDSGAAYYGAHLGLGYLWNITEASSLDLYTKYFWTHQDSDSVSVTGDPVKFKSADSHRWRGGARFSHALATESGLVFTPYIGAAYEHEFDGKAGATVYGYSLGAPDLKGGTGLGELGLSFKPLTTSGLSLDLGVQGYIGVREGLTGSFQFKWEF